MKKKKNTNIEVDMIGNNYDFCASVRFSLFWNSLKYKYENNIEVAEFYLYQTLVDEVSSLALALNLDYKLCEALAYVHGFPFCDYGSVGWKVIEDYLSDNHIDITINQIKCEITKRGIKSVRQSPANDFESYVDEMFSDNHNTKEIQLVCECYKIIKTLQPLKKIDNKRFFQVETEAITELKKKALETGEICAVELSKYIPEDIPQIDMYLDKEIYQELYNTLSEEIKYYNERYTELSSYEKLICGISAFVNN